MSLIPIANPNDVRNTLLFLGTGTSVGVPTIGCGCEVCQSTNPRNQRTRCSLAIGLPEGTLLVDSSPDLRMQLLRERIGMIHAVLYTHEHADHLFGLDDLRVFPYYLGHRLPLYCESFVEERIRKSFDYAFHPDVDSAQTSYPRLTLQPIALEPFSVLGAQVVPIRLYHGRFKVLGFRFGNIAYCTDVNSIPDESWPLLEGLDVLILDALRIKHHPTHFNVAQAVEAARRIGAKRTYFTHIAHEIDHDTVNATLPPGMELAYDGLRLELS
ncbi:MAG: MBL fold metallo-hydrolase [Planctomycetaceae bacterium]|nr:MBL fold metallo-hydrolase [Planctomycetaceae bacterium]